MTLLTFQSRSRLSKANDSLGQQTRLADANAAQALLQKDKAQQANSVAESVARRLSLKNEELVKAISEIERQRSEAWQATRRALLIAKEQLALRWVSEARADLSYSRLLKRVLSHRILPDDPLTGASMLDLAQRSWFLIATLEGHRGAVQSLAFSADGRTMVSGSADGYLRLWDAKSGRPVGGQIGERKHYRWAMPWMFTSKGRRHWSGESPSNAVAFSPDARSVASGSSDWTLRIWDVQTGQPIGEPMRGHEGEVRSVAFSPDGRLVVSGSDDKTLQLWDAKTGKPIGDPMRGHESRVIGVAFSPDGQRLVSGGADASVCIWNARTRQLIGEPIQGLRARVNSLAFSPDRKQVLFADHDKTLRIWDVRTGQPIGEPMRGHDQKVTSVAFSPDGQRVVSGSVVGTLLLWDAKTGRSLGEPMRGHEDSVLSVSFSQDGQRVVSASYDNTLRLWDVKAEQSAEPPKIFQQLSGVQGESYKREAGVISQDGRWVLAGDMDNLRVWNTQTGEPVGPPLNLSGGYGDPNKFALSPNGMWVAIADSRTIGFWNSRTGELIGDRHWGDAGEVRSVAFSSDGYTVATGGADGELRVWDARNGHQIRKAIGLPYPLSWDEKLGSSVAFSPDGQRLVSGSGNGTLRIWQVHTGRPAGAPMQANDDEVSSVAFSPDGRRLMSLYADGSLRLWDTQAGTPIGKLMQGHRGEVTSVAFSPDAHWLVSGGMDGTLRFYDVKTGQLIGEPLRGNGNFVRSAAFSTGGDAVFSVGSDLTLRKWQTPSGIARWLCERIGRNPTQVELKEWGAEGLNLPLACPMFLPGK
ncbi:WD40 repeat domain-containing protein [Paucibacter sp. DJ2R-2]|uniref:WD40 repeat domain-containing protein n=1 Tax=Paucibacter sp. DJ2R-2 TaxID=2893558 RepID=UPI0021E4C4FA|nr:WD40 repeat domain-containing protein [Paucibacter sp. DJ2R-2]MCV2441286.1 WD40 repeat domain-containing protein [Paucibacter sp. DJ2R-2]